MAALAVPAALAADVWAEAKARAPASGMLAQATASAMLVGRATEMGWATGRWGGNREVGRALGPAMGTAAGCMREGATGAATAKEGATG